MSHTNPPVGPFAVEEPIYCSLTRFGFRSPRHLLAARRDFGRVARAAEEAKVPNLLKSAFLVENATAGISFSLWSDKPQISAHLDEHRDAANHVFGHLSQDGGRGPELWSTEWRLDSVSNNLRWEGFDLERELGGFASLMPVATRSV